MTLTFLLEQLVVVLQFTVGIAREKNVDRTRCRVQ